MFIAPFTNLKMFSAQGRNEKEGIYESHLDLWGAAMNLTTYSKENQPTNTASAISKKYSSPKKIFIYNVSFVQVY